MLSQLYTRDILRLAVSIPHLGRLDSPDGSAERRSPVCGSRVVVDVRLGVAGEVVGLGQEVHACALGQAAAAVMGTSAIGRTPAELRDASGAVAAFLAGEGQAPAAWPGLEVLAVARDYPARHSAILLPFHVVAEAAELALAPAPSV